MNLWPQSQELLQRAAVRNKCLGKGRNSSKPLTCKRVWRPLTRSFEILAPRPKGTMAWVRPLSSGSEGKKCEISGNCGGNWLTQESKKRNLHEEVWASMNQKLI